MSDESERKDLFLQGLDIAMETELEWKQTLLLIEKYLASRKL